MIRYSSLNSKSRILQSFTGLTVQEFEALLPSFSAAWDAFVQETWVIGKTRARGYGGGRTEILEEIEDKLLFILFYFRQYPIQTVQGYLFGMGQPQANLWVHRLSGVLNEALGEEQHLPERNPRRLKEVLDACPGVEFMIDGTDRPIRRPKDKVEQAVNYSGKKKRHTVKNVVITGRKGNVVYLSETYAGRVTDIGVCQGEEYEFPEGSDLWQDSGFQGYAPPGVRVHQPKKKPPGGELTQEEKEQNREISRIRVDVEHQIGGVKRCNIVSHIFRNRKENYVDEVMETACGLHNLRRYHRQDVAKRAA